MTEYAAIFRRKARIRPGRNGAQQAEICPTIARAMALLPLPGETMRALLVTTCLTPVILLVAGLIAEKMCTLPPDETDTTTTTLSGEPQ